MSNVSSIALKKLPRQSISCRQNMISRSRLATSLQIRNVIHSSDFKGQFLPELDWLNKEHEVQERGPNPDFTVENPYIEPHFQ